MERSCRARHTRAAMDMLLTAATCVSQAINAELRQQSLNQAAQQQVAPQTVETGFDLRFGGLGENQVGS